MRSLTPNALVLVIITLALFGFADATFLFAKRVSGEVIPCFITTGCDTVTKSPYSLLFGIPLALYGAVFYLAVGALGLLYLDTRKLFIGKLLAGASLIGFLMSAYFIYIQKFKIGAFCIWCLASAIIATLIFVFGIAFWRAIRKQGLSLPSY